MKNRKIAVIGSRAVGKSSLILQFVQGHFVDSYFPTIENSYSKSLNINNQEYTLEIQDTAGQDEWGIMTSSFTLGIHAYVIVYSISSLSSLETARVLHDKILNFTGSTRIPCVLVANKSDLSSTQVSMEDGLKVASEFKCKLIESSAKLNTNIETVFGQAILESIRSESSSDIFNDIKGNGNITSNSSNSGGGSNKCIVC